MMSAKIFAPIITQNHINQRIIFYIGDTGIDIFDDMNKRKIAMSMMSHQEEVQLLQDKIKALEHALMMSNIKAEGYEIMMDILKREHGIDLSKKVAAEQSMNSKSGGAEQSSL